ncbi:CPBP family intramembrane glutamic endopeptidase [Clostridium sp.]|jgi:membrane protease YdiL (CAAX protease family)|uniref:CPBP family intramembrane glutamic endopeptidase n=1 Tax=Clostridium sp. TaxID=1506 RepID=UPI0025894687|nr:CPBP family intramembrane glutamic endopeptidase [Clostridium sp.]MDF2506075.1 amino terminal protease family [Clostridium sp.]
MKDENIKKHIVLFLIFAFGLPLICVFLVKNFSVFQSGALSFILYGIEAMTPTVAALIVTAILGGGAGIRIFLKKCYFDNIKIRYIVLSVILPLSVLTITKLTSLIFVDSTLFIEGITSKKLIIVMWAFIAEEIGWRGFLQEKLDEFCGHLITPILLGSVWALWHYHFFWLGTMSAPLILFLIGCIADSFGYYWVTKKSEGNVIPASIWHFVGNLCFNLFLISPEYNKGNIVPYFLFAVYSIIMAVGINIGGMLSIKKTAL